MPRGNHISLERRGQIVQLYSQGLSRRRVAEETGAVIATVNKVLVEEGVEIRPVQERLFGPGEEAAIIESYQAGNTIGALAGSHNCTIMTIHKILRRCGIPLRDDRGRRRDYTEAELGLVQAMAQAGKSQATIARALHSSQETVSKLMRQNGISPARRGPASKEHHYKWAGGRTQDPSGYWHVRLLPTDPMFIMATRSGYVLEHRLVMARALGRPLLASESVHHINGDRSKNQLENLQLRLGQHGSHAAFQCQDCGSTNIIAVKIKE